MRGQVTLYLIIGILLVIVIGAVFFFTSLDDDIPSSAQFNTQDVEEMVLSCIRDTGKEGLDLLGKQGNYIDVPPLLQADDTAYWIMEYSNVMPILNSSADEFQVWFNDNFEDCVDYSGFSEEISAGGPVSLIHYGAESVVINLNYPLNITRGDEKKELKEWQEVLNVRYRRVYEQAREITHAHFLQQFDFRKPLEFVETQRRNLSIVFQEADENNLFFQITDEQQYEGGNFVFEFATNLNRSNVKRTVGVNKEMLSSPLPFVHWSPDRKLSLVTLPDTKFVFPDGRVIDKNSNPTLFGEITLDQEYYDRVSRNVTHYVGYSTKGTSVSGRNELMSEIWWNLTYPTYVLEPSGLQFQRAGTTDSYPQPLVVYWDDEKTPNDGPMGLLYRGEFSDYEWVPIQVEENYNESFVSTNILGFSEYSPVDCSFQQCKAATVQGTSEPQAMCWIMAAIMIIAIIAVIVTFGAALAAAAIGGASLSAGFSAGLASLTGGLLGSTTMAVTSSAVVGSVTTALAVSSIAGTIAMVAGIGAAALTFAGVDAYGSGEKSIDFVPTCDQILEVACVEGGSVKGKFGNIISDDYPDSIDLPTGTLDLPVEGGVAQTITAGATACKSKFFFCESCSYACSVAYK